MHGSPIRPSRNIATTSSLKEPNRRLRGFLDSLQVYCPVEGCSAKIKAEELERHVEKCKTSRWFQCTKGCDQLIKLNDLKNHDCLDTLKTLLKFEVARTLSLQGEKSQQSSCSSSVIQDLQRQNGSLKDALALKQAEINDRCEELEKQNLSLQRQNASLKKEMKDALALKQAEIYDRCEELEKQNLSLQRQNASLKKEMKDALALKQAEINNRCEELEEQNLWQLLRENASLKEQIKDALALKQAEISDRCEELEEQNLSLQRQNASLKKEMKDVLALKEAEINDRCEELEKQNLWQLQRQNASLKKEMKDALALKQAEINDRCEELEKQNLSLQRQNASLKKEIKDARALKEEQTNDFFIQLRRSVTTSSLKEPNRRLRGFLDSLQVYCPVEGCSVKIKAEELERHVEKCKNSRWIRCTKGCDQLIKLSDLKNHDCLDTLKTLLKFEIARTLSIQGQGEKSQKGSCSSSVIQDLQRQNVSLKDALALKETEINNLKSQLRGNESLIEQQQNTIRDLTNRCKELEVQRQATVIQGLPQQLQTLSLKNEVAVAGPSGAPVAASQPGSSAPSAERELQWSPCGDGFKFICQLKVNSDLEIGEEVWSPVLRKDGFLPSLPKELEIVPNAETFAFAGVPFMEENDEMYSPPLDCLWRQWKLRLKRGQGESGGYVALVAQPDAQNDWLKNSHIILTLKAQKGYDSAEECSRIPGIESLSEEILLHIFKFLPLRELLRIAPVCRRWHRVAMDSSLWDAVDLSDDLSSALHCACALKSAVQRRTRYLSLAMSPFFDPLRQMNYLLQSSLLCRHRHWPLKAKSRLVFLDLSGCDVPSHVLSAILRSSLHLQKLSLEYCELDTEICDALSNCRRLRVLDLARTTGGKGYDIARFLLVLTRLEELSLCSSKIRSLEEICLALPRSLRRLSLGNVLTSKEDLQKISWTCDSLQELDLSPNFLLGRDSIQVIGSWLLNLEILKLRWCESLTIDDFRLLRPLRRLRVLLCHRESSQGFLSQIDHIRRLTENPTLEVNSTNAFVCTVARPYVGERKGYIWGKRIRRNFASASSQDKETLHENIQLVVKETYPTTTTAAPSNTTTTAKPSPAPSGSGGGGFSAASFIGGIILLAVIQVIGFLGFKFYRSRTGGAPANYSNLQ
ncbi:unnamed protein product [Cyprideis torosa]|uniref:Uncharacterized protein n=1 Tax=Cyprideis torosa TaxID=163714 RepID=A0A7R8ZK60_9CRUS|nr:unnamed protein product [Cyprideis torosa]CAG0888631.1 unnamed protein product [Cyprideis torosa]